MNAYKIFFLRQNILSIESFPTKKLGLIYSQENAALPLQEALRLTIEACRVWIVCLRFGLETERFREFYPIIINHIKFLNTNVSMVEVSVQFTRSTRYILMNLKLKRETNIVFSFILWLDFLKFQFIYPINNFCLCGELRVSK